MKLTRPRLFAPLLFAAALATSLVQAGYRLAGSDAGALLTAASKILRGGVFYRDIDSYAFPGAAYLLAGVMRVFGESVGVARTLAALVFCATVLALYAIALRVLGAKRAATFGALLLAFKLVAWPSFTAYYYWDLAFGFGCGAAALLLGHSFRGPTLRLALAGLLVGFAVVSKQSLGLPLAGVMFLLLLWPRVVAGFSREHSRDRVSEAATFAVAAALPALLMAAYFASHGLLGALIESGLLRPFSAYLPTSSTSFLEPLAWWRIGELQGLPGLAYSMEPLWTLLTQQEIPGAPLYPFFWFGSELFSRLVYSSVPFAFAAALWLRVRQPEAGDAGAGSGERHALFVFAPLAAAIFLSAFPRADFTHVISVYPVVLLVLFALPGRGSLRADRGLRAASAAALALCVALAGVQTAKLTHHMDLPRASLWISPKKSWIESTVRFVSAEVDEGKPFFVYGHEAFYYFLADRYSPWRYSQLYVGQAGGDDGKALVEALRRDPPELVLRGATRFPRVTPIPSYTPLLARHLRAAYEPEPAVFERYPPADAARPTGRQFQMLRKR